MSEPIKILLRQRSLPYWRLADELGISENTLGRWLRHPLDPEKQQRIAAAIQRLTPKVEDEMEIHIINPQKVFKCDGDPHD